MSLDVEGESFITDTRTYILSILGLNQDGLTAKIKREVRHHTVGLMYFDVAQFGLIEQKFGKTVCERILRLTREIITEITHEETDYVGHKSIGDDSFVFVRLANQSTAQMTKTLHELAVHIQQVLNGRLNTSLRLRAHTIHLHVGTALIQTTSPQGIEQSLYNAMKHAIFVAKSEADLEYKLRRSEFLDILDKRQIRPVYQPIVSLATGELFAYESLTRGPADSFFSAPLHLFDFAEHEECQYTLEKIARETSIRGFASMNTPAKLFLNVNADVILDPAFTPHDIIRFIQEVGVDPNRVVFELTERNAVRDFQKLGDLFSEFRKEGFQIALDDAGAGYSSLQAIAELRPDYIKIDRALINDIHKNRVKSSLLEALVAFSMKIRCQVIAEGIETQSDLEKVIQMGVHYGQGYLFGKPDSKTATLPADITESILARTRTQHPFGLDRDRVSDVVQSVKTFDVHTKVADIVKFFNEHELESGVVVTRDHCPAGLVMREKLFQSLAFQYGVALYWNRSIDNLMDKTPLALEWNETIENASRLSMARDHDRIYDPVIVVQNGALLGVVTIQAILDSITNARIESARDANPLTGLPGNRLIEREIARQFESMHPFSIIYADLDYFKWYNDRFGFQRGDAVIRYVADLLKDALRVSKKAESFLGHIGGDDFILILQGTGHDDICEAIVAAFDIGIQSFYDDARQVAAAPAHLEVTDREGRVVDTDGISISLSLLECQPQEQTSLNGIAEAASRLKKKAKAHRGSTLVRGAYA